MVRCTKRLNKKLTLKNNTMTDLKGKDNALYTVLGTGDVCKITNDKFSWVLEVDGKIITFNGSDNADYFAELYTKLGYNIEWDRDKWQRD
ncbi:MAG: hypothetical protein HRU18_03745 [Pseudoalteromonas sp.]|uniref:hypothetical protein n=1 Tax=Pseudoalteromonas sp. TaxID=53249 RepID=UPI001D1E3098|nr:hypothetical protein [Pseudoalteromonas sp.]NRA77300.1 hypothetical protein [Pseudoalteromonas sp.]